MQGELGEWTGVRGELGGVDRCVRGAGGMDRCVRQAGRGRQVCEESQKTVLQGLDRGRNRQGCGGRCPGSTAHRMASRSPMGTPCVQGADLGRQLSPQGQPGQGCVAHGECSGAAGGGVWVACEHRIGTGVSGLPRGCWRQRGWSPGGGGESPRAGRGGTWALK